MQANHIERREKHVHVNEDRRSKTGESTLAGLDAKASVASATAGKDEKSGQNVNFSAQWLFDRFIANDDAETTKFDLVRKMTESLDFKSFKDRVNDMVKIAKDVKETAEKTAREGGIDLAKTITPNVANATARYNMAQKHRSYMKNIYGGLRLAKDEMDELMKNSTRQGYLTASSLGSQALKVKGIKWDGTKIVEKTERLEKQKQKEQKEFLAQLQKETPQKHGESMREYNDRVLSLFDVEFPLHVANQAALGMDEIANDFILKYRERSGDVLNHILKMWTEQGTDILASDEGDIPE